MGITRLILLPDRDQRGYGDVLGQAQQLLHAGRVEVQYRRGAVPHRLRGEHQVADGEVRDPVPTALAREKRWRPTPNSAPNRSARFPLMRAQAGSARPGWMISSRFASTSSMSA